MTPHTLPTDWQWVTLGSITKIIGGTTPSTTNPDYWNGEFLWITPAEIDDNSKFIYHTKRTITQQAIKDKSLRELPIGTILLSSRAPIGKVAITGNTMYCNQGFKNLVCDKTRLYNLYLFYFLKSKTSFLNSLGRGTTFKEISKKIVEEIPIPLPPLEIQKQIVDVLESKLEKIQEIKALLESSLKDCETYRASLLESAFRGELTPHSTDWQWVKLGEICDVRDGTHDTPQYIQDGYPLVTSKNLKNGVIDIANTKNISKIDYDKINERSRVDEGDILFAMIGTIGNPVIVRGKVNFAIKNVALFKQSQYITPDFLSLLLQDKKIIQKMLDEAKGTTQKFVSLSYLRNFQIPLPPLEIQKQIVEVLESKLEKIQEIKALLESSLKDCETYRASLLESAFRGELV